MNALTTFKRIMKQLPQERYLKIAHVLSIFVN
ncbi:hypothetical protein NUACC26_057680 [Scytonema sp. NUACC26]